MLMCVMTVHKLSVGDGYQYYVNEVATGDALRQNGREIGDYYAVHGMPPGQWIGTAPEALGLSGEVSEAHMHTLFGQKFTPIAPMRRTVSMLRSARGRFLPAPKLA